MNNSEEVKEVDVSQEIGYFTISAADQTRGKWFPDSKVKPGTRWFYLLIAFIMISSIIVSSVEILSIAFR